MIFSWVNNDMPEERLNVPWVLVGHQSDGSQSFGSGLSYAMRYFLLKFFNAAAPNDDPAKRRSEQKAAEAEKDKMIAQEIVRLLDEKSENFRSKPNQRKNGRSAPTVPPRREGKITERADSSEARACP